MSTQSQQRTNVADAGQRVNISSNRFGGPSLAGRNPAAVQQFQPTNDAEQPAEDNSDPSYLQPSLMSSQSTLALRPVRPANYPATCWFAPLGYCLPGICRNGFCSYHVRHLFNAQAHTQYLTKVGDDSKLEVLACDRMLSAVPMSFEPVLVRMMPLPELYEKLEDLERELNFGMLHYTLSNAYPRKSADEVNRIVMEHKAYFMLMMEASVSNSDTSSRNVEIPAIVRINTEAAVKYVSNQLNQKSYNIHLAIANSQTRSLFHMDLRKCTVFTQSIVLMFEQPYAFNSMLNVSIANHPSILVAERYLVADQTKLFNGTFKLADGTITEGSPMTVSIFRFDTNGEVSFYSKNFVPSQELCLRTNIDRQQLYRYAMAEQPVMGVPPQQNQV